jgi:thiol-disulfide isomerase/thioredoxin
MLRPGDEAACKARPCNWLSDPHACRRAPLCRRAATWCGPCLLLAQELEQVAEEMGDQVDILKLDVDENPDLASALQVRLGDGLVALGARASQQQQQQQQQQEEGDARACGGRGWLQPSLIVQPRRPSPPPTPPISTPHPPQIAGLPTMIFIGTDDKKPALRSEGLMTAETIKSIIKKDLLAAAPPPAA